MSDRLDEIECRSARTQLFVDRVHERVHLHRLIGTDVHQRTSVICDEILRRLADPVRRCRIRSAAQDYRRQRHDDLMQFLRPGDESMVRHGTDQRRCRLNRVEPAHLLRTARIAARGEVSGKAQMPGRGTQEIAVDGEDHVSGRQVRHALNRRTEGECASLPNVVAGNRLPLVPTRRRILREQRVKLRGESRRGDAASQDPECCTVVLGDFRPLRQQRGQQQLPISGEVMGGYRGRTIRIVEIQHLGLGEHVGSAEACRMLRITLDFDRPAHLMLNDNARCVTVHDIGGAVEVR